jgi:hypothetical protein
MSLDKNNSSGISVTYSPECPCKETVVVRVHIDRDLACEGRAKWKRAKIDYCISDIVKALQGAGINMRGSCCGHGKEIGTIGLSDGRRLLIYPVIKPYKIQHWQWRGKKP